MRRAALHAARPHAAALIADRVINATRITRYSLLVTNHVDYPSLSTH